MSDTWLRIIPTDPSFEPDADTAAAVVDVVRGLVPAADEVAAEADGEVLFIGAGANLERIGCPHCGQELSIGWWGAAMDAASRTVFTELAVTLPCCGTAGDLNELEYVTPQGFARWLVKARNPGRATLDAEEVAAVAAALGHDVRVVRTRI